MQKPLPELPHGYGPRGGAWCVDVFCSAPTNLRRFTEIFYDLRFITLCVCEREVLVHVCAKLLVPKKVKLCFMLQLDVESLTLLCVARRESSTGATSLSVVHSALNCTELHSIVLYTGNTSNTEHLSNGCINGLYCNSWSQAL